MSTSVIEQTCCPKKPIQDTPLDLETVAEICKALAHPTRLKILKYLEQTDRCICGRIVDLFPLAQSTVSQHLKSLKQAGLIWGEVEGLNTCYCLNKEMLEKFKKSIEAL
jgi:predicted transcriptional regulator